MKNVEKALSVELIDYAPVFLGFGPDEILTVSGILTAKKDSFKKMLKKIDKNLAKNFHREATKRGHASLLTTPVFYFWIEGSRIIDLFLTAFPFGSYLMFSSRRIKIAMHNIIIPDFIERSPYKGEYEKVCRKMLEVYKELLKAGCDQARNILPLGFSSYGFFSFPAQTLLTCIKECEMNAKIPEELKIIAKNFKTALKNSVPILFEAAERAYETGFPFPNIFGDCKIDENEKIEVVYCGSIGKIFEMKARGWKELAQAAQNEILVSVVSSLSLAAWNEIKRHRTVRQSVESVYSAAERYLKNPKEEYFHIPPSADESYKEAFHEAMALYEKLVDGGVEKRHAIYIVPHALKIKFKLLLDGFHLLDPFGFIGVRACSTTHYEVRDFVGKIIARMACNIPELAEFLGPKCKTGACPEKNSCGRVKEFQKS